MPAKIKDSVRKRLIRDIMEKGYSEHDATVIANWECKKHEAVLERNWRDLKEKLRQEEIARFEEKANEEMGISFEDEGER